MNRQIDKEVSGLSDRKGGYSQYFIFFVT
jgi:hypothetical protein